MQKEIKISQNFLKSPKFVLSLIEQSDISKDDIVVEIGAGKGIITKQLSLKCKKVIGIEYDYNLATKLREKFSDLDNIEIVKEDFLKYELPKFPYKVFSNIPFNMTADIVIKLLESGNPPLSTYLILQDKAAGRFIGNPVATNSQTSILLQPFYDMGIITRISRNEFSPVPNVNAVLAKFIKKENPLVDSRSKKEYRDFIIYGFNQWKSTVLSAFKEVFSYKQTKIIRNNLKLEDLKPTELTLQQWLGLFETYMECVPDNKKDFVRGSELYFKNKHRQIKKVHRTRES